MYYAHYVRKITPEEVGKTTLHKIARVEVLEEVIEGRTTIVNSSTPDGIIVIDKGSRLLPAGQYGSNYYRNARIQCTVAYIYQVDGKLFDKEEAVTYLSEELGCMVEEAEEYLKTLPRLTK